MTSHISLLAVGISHQVAGAPANVASQVVFAMGSVVARMLLALINIDAVQPAIVFITEFAFTECLAVLDSARAVGSALHPVTRTFAHKIDTLLVERAVSVV